MDHLIPPGGSGGDATAGLYPPGSAAAAQRPAAGDEEPAVPAPEGWRAEDGPATPHPLNPTAVKEWSDACRFQCPSCPRQFKCSDELRAHAVPTHHLDTLEAAKCRTREVYHRCLLCGKDILHCHKQLVQHTTKMHNLTMGEYYQTYVLGGQRPPKEEPAEVKPDIVGAAVAAAAASVSTAVAAPQKPSAVTPATLARLADLKDWAEGCSYQCPHCLKESRNSDDLRKHVRSAHGVKGSFIASQYRTSLRYHRCLLCGSGIQHCFKQLNQHITKIHNLELLDYHERYVSTSDAPVEPPIITKPPALGEEIVRPKKAPPANKIVKAPDGSVAVVKGHGGPEDPSCLKAVRDWSEGCAYQCPTCQTVFRSSDELRRHSHSAHKTFNFQASHHRTVSAQHKCEICGKSIQHCHKQLKQHFTKMHNMPLTQYFSEYIQKSGGPAAAPPAPNGNGAAPAASTHAPKVETSKHMPMGQPANAHSHAGHSGSQQPYTPVHPQPYINQQQQHHHHQQPQQQQQLQPPQQQLQQPQQPQPQQQQPQQSQSYPAAAVAAANPQRGHLDQQMKMINQFLGNSNALSGQVPGLPIQNYPCLLCLQTMTDKGVFERHIHENHGLSMAFYEQMFQKVVASKKFQPNIPA